MNSELNRHIKEGVDKEPGDSQIILEIGSGYEPAISDFDSEHLSWFEKDSSARYIGIDVDKKYLESGKRLFRENLHADADKVMDRTLFLQASGENLPIKDEAANTIVLKNFWRESPEITLQPTADEIYRALKAGGSLIVIENNSPLGAGEHFRRFSDNRFALGAVITWEDLQQKPNLQTVSPYLKFIKNPGDYLALFQKKLESEDLAKPL